jgi:hypothetical protein
MKTFIKKLGIISTFVVILSTLSVPLISYAQTTANTNSNTSLAVNCDGAATTTTNGVEPCDFNALIGTATHLIDWLFYISIPIMVALMAWSGILYMTGNPKNIAKAKGVFMKVAVGFTIMLVAFLVVDTVIGWIGNPSFTTNSSQGPSNPAVFLQN